ncbi:MAG: nucleotidyltransferase family protein [Gemmataceae bacterium]|nr:nucleotidyltransferase family protein [Gemmataceae bacterium]MDW8266747.1 nucleotidyltransferase family protein [Gemmataceae bacterium]
MSASSPAIRAVPFAVVPAAGKSERMGRPKLALPLGPRSVLEHTVQTLRDAGVPHVLVVVGPHLPELVPLAERAGAQVLQLTQPTPDMRGTVEAGLRVLEEVFHPNADDGWLLVPADHPVLDVTAIRELLAAPRRHPDCSLFVPTYAGRRGHPALLAWRHVPEIRALPVPQGLNAYLRQHAAVLAEVPVSSPSVLVDLDTPDDYDRLLRGLW